MGAPPLEGSRPGLDGAWDSERCPCPRGWLEQEHLCGLRFFDTRNLPCLSLKPFPLSLRCGHLITPPSRALPTPGLLFSRLTPPLPRAPSRAWLGTLQHVSWRECPGLPSPLSLPRVSPAAAPRPQCPPVSVCPSLCPPHPARP